MMRKRSGGLWRISYFLISGYIIIFFISCRQAPVNQFQSDNNAALSVYFFHLTARCEVCSAIEENTRKVLEEYYKNQMEAGTIKFSSINIDNRESRAITRKYQISYTSLLLVRADGTFTDFTNISLNYAYMNPSKFEELLKAEIDKNLE
jgi:hypothetical protein